MYFCPLTLYKSVLAAVLGVRRQPSRALPWRACGVLGCPALAHGIIVSHKIRQ